MSKENLGQRLRRLRQEKNLPLRKVAAALDIDVAILSKMERGERKLSKGIVVKLAKLYDHDPEELTILFLGEKIMYEVGEEDLALKAMIVAEESLGYGRVEMVGKESIAPLLKDFFKKDIRVKAAWLYGSFARGDMNFKSDIDVMVRFNDKMKITLFDIADIAHKLELLTKRKIDLVEEGCLKPFALKTAQNDLIKIYG